MQRKTRKRSKAVVEANLKEQVQHKRRKKAGRLAQLPNMPLDVLFEVRLTISFFTVVTTLQTDFWTSSSLRSTEVD